MRYSTKKKKKKVGGWEGVGGGNSRNCCGVFQVRVTGDDSGLCCITCVTYFERKLTPFCVHSVVYFAELWYGSSTMYSLLH